MKKISLLVVMVSCCSFLYAQKSNDFEIQQNNDGTISITNYKGSETNIVIPEKILNIYVTGISEDAFRGKGLESVVIPESVIYIGARAFAENIITKINLPKNTKSINENVFAYNRIEKIIIPNDVIAIEAGAFEKNRLQAVEIPASVKVIAERAFARNKISSLKLNSGLLSVGYKAFSLNYLSSLTIPQTVVHIGQCAFNDGNFASYEKLKELNIESEYITLEMDSDQKGAFNLELDNLYKQNHHRKGKYIKQDKKWIYKN